MMEIADRDRRLGIQVAEEMEQYARRQKTAALRRGDDYAAHAYDELKANSRDAAAALRTAHREALIGDNEETK